MKRKCIQRLRFDRVTLNVGQQRLLNDCNFEFPLGESCRFVFRSDRDRFHFFNGFFQLRGFRKGRYFFNDDDVLDFSFEEFLTYKLNIGYAFSTKGVLHNRTLRENLLLPVQYHKIFSPEEADRRADYLLDFFELGEERNLRPAHVPVSHVKSIMILRAFIHNPELIILDAPDNLLSNKLQANLLQLVEEQRRERGLKHFFFATQDEPLAECLADSSILVSSGKMEYVNHGAKYMRRPS